MAKGGTKVGVTIALLLLMMAIVGWWAWRGRDGVPVISRGPEAVGQRGTSRAAASAAADSIMFAQAGVAGRPVVGRVTFHGKPFAGATVPAILAAVSDAEGDWAAQTAAMLRSRSPLMLCVTLEQIRRARSMALDDELRMELDMMYHVFRIGEKVEGIRALAVDKDHQPKWQPARLDDVSAARVRSFFDSPWRREEHPLASLGR